MTALMFLLLTFPIPVQDSGPQSIRALLARQQDDWNRGDIEAFMSGYERSEDLVFTSGGNVYRGWRSALERYRKNYPDRTAMGRLEFSNLEIRMLGANAAVVLGKWALERKSDHPHGIFTLVLEKESGQWRIIHDHTSSVP